MKELRRQAQSGALCSILLAAALFMRLFVPTGWMPVVDASGIRFELCTGRAVSPQPLPVADHHLHHAGHQTHGDQQAPKPGEHADQPCAFAGLGMAFLEGANPASVPIVAFAAPVPSRPFEAVPGRGLAAPPPPSTGPPPSFA